MLHLSPFVLDLRKGMVPLMMPETSCNTDEFMLVPMCHMKSHVAPYLDCPHLGMQWCH